MCNFSLDGTQAKGYSSYSPLSLTLFLSLSGCFHAPSLPSSSCSLMSPFHYQPSIYQPFFFFFFFLGVTFLTHSFGQGCCDCGCIFAPWSLQPCVCVCVRAWLLCLGVFGCAYQTVSAQVYELVCVYLLLLCCIYRYLCLHAYTHPYIRAWMSLFVSMTLSDLCSYLLLSMLSVTWAVLSHADLMWTENRDRAAALSDV